MRKLIFAINATIDGFADHTAVIADDELHDFYTNLLNDVDILLFSRKTYQLMESYWPNASGDPQATKSMIGFVRKINSIPKIVFSRTLDKVNLSAEAAAQAGWNNTRLIKENIVEEVKKLKNQSGKNISISGLSTVSAFMEEGLIDEYWFLIQPVVLGNGRRLFENTSDRINLKLDEVEKFKSGVVVLHYRKP